MYVRESMGRGGVVDRVRERGGLAGCEGACCRALIDADLVQPQ